MATVIPFQSARQPSAPPPGPRITSSGKTDLPATGGRRGEYAIADVARSLGMLHFSVRAIIEKLRVLASHDGMPLPRTPRIVNSKPKTGPLVIYSKSRWDAGEFDAWLDGRGPAAPAAPLPAPIRAEMAQRATRLAAR